MSELSMQSIARLARAIGARFPTRDARIGLWGRNSRAYAECLLAVVTSGRIAVPLNVKSDRDGFSAVTARAGLTQVIYFGERSDDDWDVEWIDVNEFKMAADITSTNSTPHAATALAVLVSTSGSSGEVKIVAHRHDALVAHARSVCGQLGVTASDCWLACLPFHHIGGLAIPFRCWVAGAQLECGDPSDLDSLEQLLDSGSVSLVSLVPTQLQRLLERRGGRPFHARVRALIVGGGPVPERLLRACPLALPTYGMTESGSMLTCARPGADTAERFSAGVALPGVHLRIDSETGEIEARGPGLAAGYWVDGNVTAFANREGWLRTGDLGCLDADGCLQLVGRADLQMKSGGEKIHPAEIERALERIPGVRQAVVLPQRDELWGERPAAFIVAEAESTLTVEDLRSELARVLPSWKLPVRIEFMVTLPLLGNGKVDVQELKRMVGIPPPPPR